MSRMHLTPGQIDMLRRAGERVEFDAAGAAVVPDHETVARWRALDVADAAATCRERLHALREGRDVGLSVREAIASVRQRAGGGG